VLKMTNSPLRYRLRTFRFDQLWLPLAFLALFMIVGFITRNQQKYYDLTRIYLSVVTPLVAGIMAAYSLLDDPALELKFAAPIKAGRMLFEKLGILFVIQAACAALMQVFASVVAADLTPLGNFWQVQLVWFIPCLAAMSLGCFASLLGAAPMSGAITIGLIWIVEVFLRDWFAANVVAKHLLWFMGGLMPAHPDLIWNQAALFGLSCTSLAAALFLLRKQERYL